MKFVVLRRRAAQIRSLDLPGHWVLGIGTTVLLVLLTLSFLAGFSVAERSSGNASSLFARLTATDQSEIDELRARLQERIDAMSARVGQLNAHIIRLDALGKRLAEMANVDSHEFDFSMAPSAGGPESGSAVAVQAPELTAMIDDFETRLVQRDAQLNVLEQIILQRELRKQILPEGRPVERGFMSSGFGNRQDPVSGEFSFHRGVDFAGNAGDLVIAVGAGVVTFAGYRPDYGYVVDVTHGDGYVTRYAHNSEVLVRQGDTVSRGQRLAIMGSTGRSTGPHVHFEVLRNGAPVNPLSYLGG
ncbi:MAG: M23 family metallopeptidase [Gammaproteobacteria bacterium]